MKKINNTKIIITLLIVIIAILGFNLFWVNTNTQKDIVSKTNYRDNINTQTTNIVQNVKDGVVTVINKAKVLERNSFNGSSFDDFINWYYNDSSALKEKIVDNAIGSGFIIKQENNKYYVLTNNHVIENASAIDIMFSDKTRTQAKVIGTSPQNDVAVIVFNSSKKHPILNFADSNQVKLGEDVIAIGSPLSTDYQQSVTKGIISKLAFEQKIAANETRNAFSTDAAINPGNSGGPLLNLNGHVIGMNTFKRSDAENLSFSMPSNDIKKIAEKILKSER